jgi:hypothetical protein
VSQRANQVYEELRDEEGSLHVELPYKTQSASETVKGSSEGERGPDRSNSVLAFLIISGPPLWRQYMPCQ